MKKYCFFLIVTFSFTKCIAHIQLHETPIAKYLKFLEISEFNSGIEMVDCIYVINLDIRHEKWERMETLLKERNLKANRVSAINGWEIPMHIQEELAGPYPTRLQGGHLGCLLSHLSVLKDAKKRNFNIVWIMEDDVKFSKDFRKIPTLLKKLSQIDPDWNVFYTDIDSKNNKGEYIRSLSSDFRPDQKHLPLKYYTKRIPVSKDLKKIGQRFGNYSFLVSKKGIKKILDYFTHVYVWTSWDTDIHYVPGIREYIPSKDIVSFDHTIPISDTIIPLPN